MASKFGGLAQLATRPTTRMSTRLGAAKRSEPASMEVVDLVKSSVGDNSAERDIPDEYKRAPGVEGCSSVFC